MRRGRLLAMIAGSVLLAMVVVPPVRARAKAGPVLADAMGLFTARPLAQSVQMSSDVLDGVGGDRYDPGWNAPGVVLVPGATPAGTGDARVQRASRALAATGRTVFVPELDLYSRTFTDADLDRLATAVRGLAARTGAPVGVLGFSYGASLAMVASTQADVPPALTHIAAFGAYYDLEGVIQAVTTGVSIVDGRRIRWQADPQAEDIFLDVVARFAAEHEREDFLRAVRGELGRDILTAETGALYDVVVNADPALTGDLVAALPPDMRETLRRFSPSSVADAIDVPVLVLHSRDDPAVPYAEGLRLAHGLPGADLVAVDLFTHVDLARRSPTGWIRAIPDLVRAWRFAGGVLVPQEPWAPPLLRRWTS